MKKLLNYVEIQTKITSLMTFTLVLLLLKFHGISLKVLETIVFFLGMFIFDLTTTAINNYIDSKTNFHDYGFSRKTLKYIIVAMFVISVVLGLWLVVLTDWVVLGLGAFCFLVGVIYTYGPMAISRHPYGEIVSGILYGYFIPFILVYINMGAAFVGVTLGSTIHIAINADAFIKFMIFGLVPTFLTAAIMLGNNTCDVEKDIEVGRFTLPYYIGQTAAVRLLATLYVLTYAALVLGVVTGLYHPLMLVVLLSAPVALTNARSFSIERVKSRSFKYVIKNFIMIMMAFIVMQIVVNIIA